MFGEVWSNLIALLGKPRVLYDFFFIFKITEYSLSRSANPLSGTFSGANEIGKEGYVYVTGL